MSTTHSNVSLGAVSLTPRIFGALQRGHCRRLGRLAWILDRSGRSDWNWDGYCVWKSLVL